MPRPGFAYSQAELEWPALPLKEWRDTRETLHLWTQIAGKVRLALCPKRNHWWHVALYLDARGLTTSPIPYGSGAFEIQFDFVHDLLRIPTTDGVEKTIPLEPQPVAEFYTRCMAALRSLGIEVAINTRPQEIQDAIPFEQDYRHAAYDGDYARRFWQVLHSTSKVLSEFESPFLGKCSPVHFFWGSFDLACTRFNGRPAPPRKGVISSEAYSHECSSAGFWPGGGEMDAAFYAYTVPEPPGLSEAAVRPDAASWNRDLKEFILMYEDVRTSPSPRQALREFFVSTYEAGARLAAWDRAALEKT